MAADDIDYTIHGGDMQLVEIGLDYQESVLAEAGTMMYMSSAVSMETGTGGGIWKGIKRKISGESFFICSFTQNDPQHRGTVAFAAPYPGKIVALDLAVFDGSFLCQKNSFLCCAHGIDVTMAFTKRIGTGLFGGEGFILQRLTGSGLAFIHAGGTLIEKHLKQGEDILVETGCLVGFSESVDYAVIAMKGVSNVLFGAEGVFITRLTGPGTIYLQSLPFARLVDRINAVQQKKYGKGWFSSRNNSADS